jgi:hypothetical protein
MCKLLAAFGILFGFGTCAAADREAQNRYDLLSEAMRKPVDEIEKGETFLPFVLETVAALVSDPQANPSKRVTILVNVESFSKRMDSPFDPEKQRVTFTTKLACVPLEAVLQTIGEQFDAVAMVRANWIELVHREAVNEELGLPPGSCPQIVRGRFKDESLKEACAKIGEQRGVSIVFSPLVEEKAKTLVTTTFYNTHFEAALGTLVDMAELKIVRRANIYFVTTPQQAAELNAEILKSAEAERRKVPHRGEPKNSPKS